MNLDANLELYGYGTSEGVRKGWESRQRAALKAPWQASLGVSTEDHWTDGKGYYKSSRIPFHQEMLVKYQHRSAQKNPVFHLVGGGTASGKNAVAKMAMSELRSPAALNTDDIRSDMPEFAQTKGTSLNGLLQEEAGRIRDGCLVSAAAHNNDILMDSPGSKGMVERVEALEASGYRAIYSYVHRDVEMALQAAIHRAQSAKDPADRRVVPEDVVRASHKKAREAFPLLAKGREVRIYDTSRSLPGKQVSKLIYHRLANGVVKVFDKEAVRRFADGEEPKIKFNF